MPSKTPFTAKARPYILPFAGLLTSFSAFAAQPQDLIQHCWQNHDHAGMSTCVSAKATEARTALNAEEARIRQSIQRDRESSHRNIAALFEANVRSFKKYRHDQCALICALASIGNGAEENKKACEAELDATRTVQLQDAAQWLIAAFAETPKTCTSTQAKAAEESITAFQTWDEVHQSFRQYAHCDDGAVWEAYDDVIDQLLADHWDTLPALQTIIDRDRSFEAFVLRHLDDLLEQRQAIAIRQSASPPPGTALATPGGYVPGY